MDSPTETEFADAMGNIQLNNDSAGFSGEALTTASLSGLQTAEQRELMNLVDRLRRAGLSSILQLPQIIVCGDQSSGKSSVLEAITEIPFPRKENLCTRFATEIILRRDAKASIICTINPDSSRPEQEQLRLRSFSRVIQNLSELPALIDDATVAMGLNKSKAFSKDVLSIEICGPDRPQLTLVDLPGLIHSANKSQSEEDVDLIRSLVEEYISQKRTIILAVISAKNDYANQVILKTCRKFDPKGARTLGIVTKPDYLRPNSENEAVWLDLVQNRDIYFELGWHLLKNRGDGEHMWSFTRRNSEELAFFSAGRYAELPSQMKGVDTLRERLSNLLFYHLKQELPVLKNELDNMIQAVHLDLQPLGKSRPTLADQRAYLAGIFGSAHDIAVMGLNGNYESSFFGKINIEAEIDGKENLRRLRAAVQHLNAAFATRMIEKGHKFHILPNGEDFLASSLPADENADEMSGPQILTREAAVRKVVKTLERSRGREMPGTFNPMIISQLFWEQSQGWGAITRNHIKDVAAACNLFLFQILDHTASQELKPKLANFTIKPALKRACEAAFREFEQVMKDNERPPLTYNPYFTEMLQGLQRDRFSVDAEETASPRTKYVANKDRETSEHDSDMDKFSADQALDTLDAFYKTEIRYYIDVIAKQVIERHLVAPIAEVFAHDVSARYSDKEISYLASEPPEVERLRNHLHCKLKMLEEGQEAFFMAMR